MSARRMCTFSLSARPWSRGRRAAPRGPTTRRASLAPVHIGRTSRALSGAFLRGIAGFGRGPAHGSIRQEVLQAGPVSADVGSVALAGSVRVTARVTIVRREHAARGRVAAVVGARVAVVARRRGASHRTTRRRRCRSRCRRRRRCTGAVVRREHAARGRVAAVVGAHVAVVARTGVAAAQPRPAQRRPWCRRCRRCTGVVFGVNTQPVAGLQPSSVHGVAVVAAELGRCEAQPVAGLQHFASCTRCRRRTR